MKLIVIGDVGAAGGHYHAGDEAMLEAALDELRARGATELTVVSADPSDSHRRYGTRSIARIGFDGASEPAREGRLADVVRAADEFAENPGTPSVRWDDPLREALASVAASDGLVIAGGGNLASQWPEHIFERRAFVAIAQRLGRPVVVSGQTLGPLFTSRDSVVTRDTVTPALLVGVRERASGVIASALGVASDRLGRGLDDAIWLASAPTDVVLPPEYCAVTIAAHAGNVQAEKFLPVVAAQLDRISIITGLPIVLVPHAGTIEGDLESGDQVIHRALADLTTSGTVTLLPVLPARQVASITRGAALVVSTRYHPVIFATSAGVPVVGIAVDDYTATKITGALENVGLAEFAIPSTAIAAGLADEVIRAAWKNRKAISAHLRGLEPALRAHSTGWWDAASAALATGTPAPLKTLTVADSTAFLAPPLSAALHDLAEWQQATSSLIAGERLEWRERSADYAAAIEIVPQLEGERGAAVAAQGEAERAHTVSELAHQAAEELTLELKQRLLDSEHVVAGLRSEVADLERTREGLTAETDRLSQELEELRNSRVLRWSQARVFSLGRRPRGGSGSSQ